MGHGVAASMIAAGLVTCVLSACGGHRQYSVLVDPSVHPRLRAREVEKIVLTEPIPFPVNGKVDRIVSMHAKHRDHLPHVVWIVQVRGSFQTRSRETVYRFSSADLSVNDRTGRVSSIGQAAG
jgi:hypothetical protein